ncbi:acyl-CoA hydrolase [Micrococcus porci]|uniref:acyl-CoA dehydrogenase family protein n=1 Tax=Micrococcus porci TaxID=2856555 RepID=UPI001CCFB92F|nr:acyl-CoA dehydrogenase family protein [Micrococcus porci]UBH24884.1 acyl-CoA hydrolase [Micrococcus porci]
MSETPWVHLPGAEGDGRPAAPTEAEAALLAAARDGEDGEAGIEPILALLSGDDAAASLDLPLTGAGRTRRQWELLASVGAVSLPAARVLEPHLDALSILDQAGVPAPRGVLGVYASESGGVSPSARPAPGAAVGDEDAVWRLDGDKPWCSLADRCTAAVVTARQEDGLRRAFLVDLGEPGMEVADPRWPSLGLAPITTVGLRFADVPAVPVGGPEWYLRRPGFAWGGIGVAAVWFGGAVHVARTLRTSLERRTAAASDGSGPGPDQVGLAALGRVDRHLHAMASLLGRAADDVDAGRLDHAHGLVEADRIRGTVAQLCTEVLDVVGQATGPGPLTGDAAHARAVADLQVYLRQHHGPRDDARLAESLLAADPAERAELQPW